MGALFSRCLDWPGDPDPVSCQMLWGKSAGNRQRQFKQQLQQQQQHQQQTRKTAAAAQENSSWSATGTGFHGRTHDARKTPLHPQWSFSSPHGTDSPPPPPSPYSTSRSSKESGWSSIYSGGSAAATAQPTTTDHPSSSSFSASRFMPAHHHHHYHQDQSSPENAPGGPGTFGFPQPGPGFGVGSMGGQDPQQQQHPSKQLQWKDDLGHKVRQTFSVRQGGTGRSDIDPEANSLRRGVQSYRMTSSE